MSRLFCTILACAAALTDAFTSHNRALRAAGPRRGSARVVVTAKVGLYYSTMSGNTETIAEFIAAASGVTAEPVGAASAADLAACDGLIVGAPTWNTGADDMRSGTDMDDWLYSTLPGADLSGKKVAVFGCGDQCGYSGNFCDAVGELYDCLTDRGATVVGMTSQDGYEHYESKAVRDDQFVGLLCDQQNQMDLSEDRATEWVAQLKAEGFPF